MTSSTKMSTGDPPMYKEHKLQHFQQRYSWDCGVSCVIMLLAPQQKEELLQNFTQLCADEGFQQSTWTIDLCYLLKRFDIRHHMYTISMGVNEDYRNKKYYDKIFDKDRERVLARFSSASSRGVPCLQQSLSTQQLLSHLAHAGPVILLVDNGLLHCDICRVNKLYTEFRRCFGGQYCGHYILLVGYNRRRHKFIYRNPARRDRLCAASYRSVERARTASGTDEDAVLVYCDR